MDIEGTLARISIWALPVLFAIIVHEVAHGWVARRLGDPTAMMLGRLTLNPLKHIDPLGTIAVPLLSLVIGGVVFGWAKPVPVYAGNFRQPRRDMAIVAIAGPISNLAMAVGWALVVKLGLIYHETLGEAGVYLVLRSVAGIVINAVLFVINLLPLPPLDGGRVLSNLVPSKIAAKLDRVEPYGLVILITLALTGVLGKLLFPVLQFVVGGLSMAFGIPSTLFGRV